MVDENHNLPFEYYPRTSELIPDLASGDPDKVKRAQDAMEQRDRALEDHLRKPVGGGSVHMYGHVMSGGVPVGDLFTTTQDDPITFNVKAGDYITATVTAGVQAEADGLGDWTVFPWDSGSAGYSYDNIAGVGWNQHQLYSLNDFDNGSTTYMWEITSAGTFTITPTIFNGLSGSGIEFELRYMSTAIIHTSS